MSVLLLQLMLDGATHCVDGTLILQRGTGRLLLPDDHRVPILATIHVHCAERGELRRMGLQKHREAENRRHKSRG